MPANYRVRSFSCWDQFLSMTFAQLSYRESLLDACSWCLFLMLVLDACSWCLLLGFWPLDFGLWPPSLLLLILTKHVSKFNRSAWHEITRPSSTAGAVVIWWVDMWKLLIKTCHRAKTGIYTPKIRQQHGEPGRTWTCDPLLRRQMRIRYKLKVVTLLL